MSAKALEIGIFAMATLQDSASSGVNGTGTCEKIDTPLTQDRSPDVLKPWEVRAAKAMEIVARIRPVKEIDRTIPAADAPHVYLAYSAGRIKIGTSMDVGARSRGLNTQSPHPVTVLLTVPGNYDLERKLHSCLAGVRLHGEWFKLTAEMRQYLDHCLCRVGKRKLRKAEAEFREWIQSEF